MSSHICHSQRCNLCFLYIHNNSNFIFWHTSYSTNFYIKFLSMNFIWIPWLWHRTVIFLSRSFPTWYLWRKPLLFFLNHHYVLIRFSWYYLKEIFGTSMVHLIISTIIFSLWYMYLLVLQLWLQLHLKNWLLIVLTPLSRPFWFWCYHFFLNIWLLHIWFSVKVIQDRTPCSFLSLFCILLTELDRRVYRQRKRL